MFIRASSGFWLVGAFQKTQVAPDEQLLQSGMNNVLRLDT